MDYRKLFGYNSEQGGFVKTAARPEIDSAQKALLNRKGNVLINKGDVEGARRIFLTTGYTDGLVRVGDYYKSQGRGLDALRMYWIAPDKTKAEGIIQQLSVIITQIIQNEEPSDE